jgi:hypothetical protein
MTAETFRTPRRSFLRTVAASGLALTPGAAAQPNRLPVVKLGKFEVTRLVAGYNPIGGYGHSVPKLSAIMRDWFTPERTVAFLRACEQQGINTWQADPEPKVIGALQAARDAGSKIQWVCLTRDVDTAKWKEIAALQPIAVVHHGGVTDRLYSSGEQNKLRDFINKAHDLGIMAGISSHSPANIVRSEDAGWSHDLYMTCFHNITRDQEKVKIALGGDTPLDELYLSGDPDRMTAVVRQVKRPCLAFKILAAGRLCGNRAAIEKAFAYAYLSIKPGDAVIVGMFPILQDEVAEDVAIARKVLTTS